MGLSHISFKNNPIYIIKIEHADGQKLGNEDRYCLGYLLLSAVHIKQKL
jgi:hypothetical protein